MRRAFCIALIAVLGLLFTQFAHARPSYATEEAGNSCSVSSCHTNIATGRMAVSGEDKLVDLGTQLDGNVRGSLKTFTVAPGSVVSLSMDVLNGNSEYAAQLKRLETGGQANDINNLLVWSEANAVNNPWTRQEVANPPYFTKDSGNNGGIAWFGSPVTLQFDLMIDATTPADFYDLEFALAGPGPGGRWYQDEHFYLEVLSSLLLGDANNDGTVTADDLIAVQQFFGTTGPADGLLLGDANDDGTVTADDLIVVQQQFGNTLGAAAGASIPESSTIALICLCVSGCAFRRRSRPATRHGE